MYIFLIAILVNYVLRLISGIAVNRYIKSGKTEEELGRSIGFQLWAVCLLTNHGLLWINITILAALAIKTYIL